VFYCFYEQIKCMHVCNVTSLVHSYIVIAVFSRPSFRAIVSALWCLFFSPFPFMVLFVLVFYHETA